VTRRLVELEGTTLNLVQIRDISDRRRLEGQMRLATKMEAIGRWPAASPTNSTTCSR
jgi:hypothetical protein